MSKRSLLISSICILAVLNITLLLAYGGFSGHRKHREPKEEIIEKLHFTDKQVKAYEVLIAEHQKAILEKDEEIRKSKNSLYALLKANDMSRKDSLINRIALLHTDIEVIHFNHFAQIKKLCTEEQMPAFNELSRELARLFSPPPPPKK